jgi:four helix bundle protein
LSFFELSSFWLVSDYKNLQVWQKAHALAIRAHRTAMGVRASRYAALRSQIIRAAMSIPANIVEGRRQDSERDFARFLRYSLNSAYELEYHLMLAKDIDVISEADARSLLADVVEVTRMLHGLLRRISPQKTTPESSKSLRRYESSEQ